MNIAVYCASDLGNDPDFRLAARQLGQWIGEKHHTLIYGGGDSGLMGIVAKAALDSGAPVIGVIPEDIPFIKERPQPYVTSLYMTPNMSERKQKMIALADAFIALPGGIGTIDEISEVITLTKIGAFNKKSVLFNKNGFYEPLHQMMAQMIAAGYLKEKDIKHVLFSQDIPEIEAFLSDSQD